MTQQINLSEQAILPSGQSLTLDGDVTFNGTVTGVVTSPAGSNTQIQFNNSGAFGASSDLTWNGSTLSVNGIINVNSHKITNLSDPTNPQDAATKTYVDNLAAGLNWKSAVVVATTVNITLSGEQTIDGVLTSSSRVLVKNQSAPAENGIYISNSGAWTRSSDMNTWAEVPAAAVFVQEGTVNADLAYICTADAGGTLGTTPITWVQFGAINTYTAGTGLTLLGNQFNLSTPVLESNGGTGVTALGDLTAAGVDGIAITGGTGVVITNASIAQQVANTSQNGYLSSTDWNTFNSKQAAGSYITALTGDATASGPGSAALTLATVNSNVGSFTNASITVNAKGLITAASNGTAPVTSVSGTTNRITSTGGTTPVIDISASYVGQASITTLGTITTGTWTGTTIAVANGGTGQTSYTDGQLLVGQTSGNTLSKVSVSGDATLANTGALTLATVNSNVGSFGSSTSIPSFTVNAKGLITAASGNAVIAPAGTLTGTTLASNVVTSSLTSVDTITSGTWQGTAVTVPFGGTGLSSLTAYAVLAGGTTSTGAVQQVSGLGTSGQVLTSNGAGTLPTWQNTAAAGANTALSNLAAVAINTSLLPVSSNTIALGSSSLPFSSAFLKTSLVLQQTAAGTNAITLAAPSSVTSYSLVMPAAQGTINQTLVNDGSGNLSWGIGSGATSQYVNYIVGTPSGSYTGSTTVFDLPFSYVQDGKTIQVMYDGVELTITSDYTETSTTQVTTTQALTVGQKIAFRSIAASGVAQAVTLYREDYIVGTPSGNYSGSTTVFALTNSYTPGGKNLTVYLDGDLQTVGATVDYLETNSTTVTFNNALIAGEKVSFLFSQSVAPGSGIVNSGASGQFTYYAANSSTVSGTSVLTLSGTRVVASNMVDTGGLRATSNSTFTSGAGLELLYQSGSGIIETFDRTGAVFTPMIIAANGLNIRNIGADKIVISSTNVDITGTTTNNSAPAGVVGEYVEALSSTAVNSAADVTFDDLVSISLTAGDWDIWAFAEWENNGATWTRHEIGISTTSGNSSAGLVQGQNWSINLYASTSATNSYNPVIPPYRVSLASTTTYYLKRRAGFSAGTPRTSGGRLAARRVR